MATGPRQQRIGNVPAGGEQNSAQPGPDWTGRIGSVKGQAEAAARRKYGAPAGRTPRTTDDTKRGG